MVGPPFVLRFVKSSTLELGRDRRCGRKQAGPGRQGASRRRGANPHERAALTLDALTGTVCSTAQLGQRRCSPGVALIAGLRQAGPAAAQIRVPHPPTGRRVT